MKIEYKKPKQAVYFADLEIGTVFRDPETETINIKTERFDNEWDVVNSVDLFSGQLSYFSDDAKIDPVEATLYIKE